MRKFFQVLLILALVFGAIAFVVSRQPQTPEQIAATTAANAKAYELAQTALDKVKPGKPRWDYIEVDKDATAKSYHLTLFYKWPGPDEEDEPEWDTKRIARAVLAELLEFRGQASGGVDYRHCSGVASHEG